jgi:hypothetical protein
LGDWVYFLTDLVLRRGIVIQFTPTRVVVAEMEEDDDGMPGPGVPEEEVTEHAV